MKALRSPITRRIVYMAVLIPVLCLVSAVFLPGCKKDFGFDKVKDLTWNPDLALQLVNDSITLRKILTQGNAGDHLVIDESGNISILYYYNNDAFRIRPSDLIRLAPAGFSYLHQISQAEQLIIRNTDLTLAPVDYSFNLSPNQSDIRVDNLLVKNGRVTVTTNNSFANDGFLTIRFANATKKGLPFSITLQPMVQGPAETTIDLAGVLFDFSATPNSIHATVEGLLKKSSVPVAGDELRAEFVLSIDTIGKFEGFLGHQILTGLQDTISLNVFNNAYTLGDLYFSDPQVSIIAVNSIGIPAEISIQKLVAINNATGSTLDIAGQLGAGAVFQVPSPVKPGLVPAIKIMTYTNANTGNAIADFFNLKPDNVAFQVNTAINPGAAVQNFFDSTSSFFDTLSVKLPLWGHFDHLTYQDTFDLVIDKPEELERLEFRTHISNGMPMYGLMQIYFTDEHYVKKDSLAGDDQILIRSAPVDPSTQLPYPGQFGIKDTVYILDMNRMQNLENVKKMLLKAVLFTANNGESDVKLKAGQAIKVNFAARAKLRTIIQTSK